MKKKVLAISLLCLLGGLAYLSYVIYLEFFVIDSCLDRGGVWNYDEGRCVGATE
jgi:hypothetical protein